MPTDAFNGKNILIIDDINDSGATFNWITNDWASKYPDADIQKIWDNNVRFAVLTENMSSEFGNVRYQAHEVNKAEKDVWLVYPWE
jgi:hypoxanthine phosphoribosyltransferase